MGRGGGPGVMLYMDTVLTYVTACVCRTLQHSNPVPGKAILFLN